jgi:hypothetical protein
MVMAVSRLAVDIADHSFENLEKEKLARGINNCHHHDTATNESEIFTLFERLIGGRKASGKIQVTLRYKSHICPVSQPCHNYRDGATLKSTKEKVHPP